MNRIFPREKRKEHMFRILSICLICALLSGSLLLPAETVQASEVENTVEELDPKMNWQSVITTTAPECEIEADSSNKTNRDVILAKAGGTVTVTLTPPEGYAIYYRIYKQAANATIMSTTMKTNKTDSGLIEGEGKTLTFDMPKEHKEGKFGIPFTYIVLKKEDGKYFSNCTTGTGELKEFDVQGADSYSSGSEWYWSMTPTEKTHPAYLTNPSWFWGYIGQADVADALTLYSVNITNLSGTGLSFNEMTLNYPNLTVNNDKDIILTAGVDGTDGGTITYTVDGTEVQANAEGSITIPGITEVGKTRTVTAITHPLEEKAFFYISQTYTFTIKRELSPAPLGSLSVTGALRNITYNKGVQYYEAAVTDSTREVTVHAEASADSRNIQYQIDDGEKISLPEDGNITVPIAAGAQPVVKIYTAAQENSTSYQQGTYTIQLRQRLTNNEILSRAAKTKDIVAGWAKELQSSNDSPWHLVELRAYGGGAMEAAGLTKEAVFNGEDVQHRLARIKVGGREEYHVVKASLSLLAAGYSVEELSNLNLYMEEGGITTNLLELLKESVSENVFNLWVAANEDVRTYIGEDVALNAALNYVAKQKPDGTYPYATGGTDGSALSGQGFAYWYGKNETITNSLNKLLAYLRGCQHKDTGLVPYSGQGYFSSETIAQWIVLLSAMGIDANDPANYGSDAGLGLVDILIDNFMLEDGMFEHLAGEGSNGMATEQGFRALVSYKGFLENGKKPFIIYDMKSQKPDTGDDNGNDDGNNDDKKDETPNTPATYTVSFDANGGKVNKSSITVTNGKTYGKLPTATRTGYTFAGWYTEKKSGKGKKITSSTKVSLSASQTLYAHWTAKSYKVTFNVNGGRALASSKRTKQVTYGKTYGKLVTPARKGYSFMGWYTKKNGGKKITKASKMQTAKAHTLYARWKKVSVARAAKPTVTSPKKKQLKVNIRKVSAAKGYQIRYSTSAKFKRGTTNTVSSAKLSKTITKLKSKKKYYIQVRAYKLDSTKQKVYGKWSSTASKTVK